MKPGMNFASAPFGQYVTLRSPLSGSWRKFLCCCSKCDKLCSDDIISDHPAVSVGVTCTMILRASRMQILTLSCQRNINQ